MIQSIGTGDVCVSCRGIVGIVTEEDQVLVRTPGGDAAPAFIGVSGLGVPWSCDDPDLLGHVAELSSFRGTFDAWCRSRGYEGTALSESQGLKILEVGRQLRMI